MNLITTLNHITDIAESLQLVNSAYKGSPYDHWNSSEIKYGSVCIAVENVSRDNLMTYNLVLYYADRLTQDRSNLYEVQTDATNILTSILNSLEEIGEVETPYNIELFDQQFSDYLAGGFVRFGLVIESPLGDCEMEDYEEDPTPYYIDKNGTYHLNGNYLLDVDVPQSGNLQTKEVKFNIGQSITVTPDPEYAGLSEVKIGQAPLDMTKVSFAGRVVTQLAQDADWSNVNALSYVFYSTSSNISNLTLDLPLVNSATNAFSNGFSIGFKKLELTGLQNLRTASDMFNRCFAEQIILPSSLPELTSANYLFSYAYVTELTMPSVPKLRSLSYTFYYMPNLTTLNLPDFSAITSVSDVVRNDTKLENLTVVALPNTSLTEFGFNTCTKLTHQSLLNILNALPTTTMQRTCSLGSTNLKKLTDEEIAIATNKGWTLN